jgi:hypothetical protein
MKTYHKNPPKPKKKKIDHVPAKKAVRTNNKIATVASTVFLKVASAFGPLNEFQQALYYTGKEHISKTKSKKPSLLGRIYQKNPRRFVIIEKITVLSIIIALFILNPYFILIPITTGYLIFYSNRVKWLWWKFKIYVLFRSFYEHRRILYKQGSLLHHFRYKKPKIYGSAVIWGESATVQNQKYRRYQRENLLTAKEYIYS